jgi:hypothetical protein
MATLSPEAFAIVAAISGQLTPQLDGMSVQLAGMQGSLHPVTQRLDSHELRLTKMESDMSALLRQVRSCYSSAHSFAGNAVASEAMAVASTWVLLGPNRFMAYQGAGIDDEERELQLPTNRRRAVIVMKFPLDTDRAEIEKCLPESCREVLIPKSEKDIRVLGRVASRGKIKFSNSQEMWKFLKARAGKRIVHQGADLWRTIIQT